VSCFKGNQMTCLRKFLVMVAFISAADAQTPPIFELLLSRCPRALATLRQMDTGSNREWTIRSAFGRLLGSWRPAVDPGGSFPL
jgi:hypothetical protein